MLSSTLLYKYKKGVAKKLELRLGKMSGREIAEWLGISYNSTYRCSTNKQLEKLNDYCEFEKVRGGVIIKEIYIKEYEKDLKMKVEKEYVKELARKNNLVTMTGMEKTTGNSRHLNTKARNHLYGDEPINKNPTAMGLLGNREMVWALKLPGDNNYRELTEKEEELLDNLITSVYSQIPADQIKAKELLLKYCAEEGMSAQQYLELQNAQGYNFFERVIEQFAMLYGYSLVAVQKHHLVQDFTKEESDYQKVLIKEMEKVKKEILNENISE